MTDSGAPRIVLDSATTGVAADVPIWSRDSRTLYFKSHDARGKRGVLVRARDRRPTTLLTRFDDPYRPSHRIGWALGPGRIYFTIEEQQSEVWVMDATLP